MTHWDISGLLWLNGVAAHEEWAGQVAWWITHMGNGWVQAALVVAWFAWRERRRLRSDLPMLVAAGLLGGLLVVAAKQAIDRPRPPQDPHVASLVTVIGGTPQDPSFPSGHAETAWCTAVYLARCYPGAAGWLLAMAGAVSVSRVMLGVHFPTDVIAGSILGALVGWGGFGWARRRRGRP